MSYVSGLKVVYGDDSNALNDEDINKGFGGDYVYLVAKYTDDRDMAACGFSLFTSYVEDLCAHDISKGDGKDLYRYIQTHHHPDNSDEKVVGSVYLKEDIMGDGHTDDLNKDRGGRYLYLCWEYAS